MPLGEKKRTDWRQSSTYKQMIRSQNQNLELKDMKKLDLNDEPFHLNLSEIIQIRDIINKGNTPTPKTYQQWDAYAISFYLKMCTCFGVDYQRLEKKKKRQLSPSSTKEIEEEAEEYRKRFRFPKQIREEDPMDRDQRKREEQMKEMEKLKRIGRIGMAPPYIKGPLKMGSYSPGTEPQRIPYHLYLLVKEADNIMKRYNNTKDLIDLEIVEKKIRFFCTYFNSHLPTGWKYKRANASFLIDGYDTTGGYRCHMAGYTPVPFGDWAGAKGFYKGNGLTPKMIVDVMSIIHSLKTPMFWGMSWKKLSFYCKLCSCFGIEYHRLEAADEEKVCLMNVGRKC